MKSTDVRLADLILPANVKAGMTRFIGKKQSTFPIWEARGKLSKEKMLISKVVGKEGIRDFCNAVKAYGIIINNEGPASLADSSPADSPPQLQS